MFIHTVSTPLRSPFFFLIVERLDLEEVLQSVDSLDVVDHLDVLFHDVLRQPFILVVVGLTIGVEFL